MIDSVTRNDLLWLSEPIRESLSKTQYNPPEGTNVSIKSLLESLLPHQSTEQDFHTEVRNFCLCCAALASAEGEYNDTTLSWVPKKLSVAANTAFGELSKTISRNFDGKESLTVGELRIVDLSVLSSISDERKLLVELMPEVLPLLKGTIKESAIDPDDEGNEISAASARTPVSYAIVAAYQFRWFVTQVNYPHLGKLCALVVPCALTALDHWSSAVKAQGMLSFIHLAKNVNAAELGWYEDVILDSCCNNIPSDDDLWHNVVEMSVLFLTCIHRMNPRSLWFEKMMNEMLSHLERQPRNKERYTTWLELIEPVFDAMGLVLLAHFRHIFPLLFQWLHTDDDKTVLLVLKRVHTIMKLTWIRNTSYIERLIDELTTIYKEAALRSAREEIREHIFQILILLHKCKGSQFEIAWDKYRHDPNLTALATSFSRETMAMVAK